MEQPVYIEVNPLLQRKLTGVGRFTVRMVDYLARRVPLRLVTDITAKKAENEGLLKGLLRGTEIAVDHSNLPALDSDVNLWRQKILKLPKQRYDPHLASKCAGVYSFLRPLVRHFRREVGILYDFTPQIVSWTHTLEMRHDFAAFVRDGCRLLEKALAISESTKSDATWLSPMRDEDITVAYPGPSQCISNHSFRGPVSRRHDVILAVSTLEPRKNPQFLVDWFLNTPALPAQTELWWAGPSGWIFDLDTLRKKGAFQRRFRFLGMVSDADLCKLFRQAAFTVYPSLYEGFGYPVLDSLLHGSPVLCSYNSSLCEFAGPGVFFFDPYNPTSVDAAYRQMMHQCTTEVDRPDLREKCSWEKVAQTVLDLCA